MVWERALSLRNPWIQQMAQYKAPEELDRSFVKKYIEQVTVILLGDGQAEIGLTMKTYEWKQMLGRIEMEETDDGTKKESPAAGTGGSFRAAAGAGRSKNTSSNLWAAFC